MTISRSNQREVTAEWDDGHLIIVERETEARRPNQHYNRKWSHEAVCLTPAEVEKLLKLLKSAQNVSSIPLGCSDVSEVK